MKKVIATVLVASMLMLSGCANSKTIATEEGTYEYQPYGVFDTEKRNDNIEYDVSIGNVILGIILVETIIAPVVIFGWYLHEPAGPKVKIDGRVIPGAR